MNFFADQAKAKSNTTKLVVLFCLAVLALIVITLLFCVLVLAFFDGKSFHDTALNATLVGNVSAIIVGVVVIAWFYKSRQLASGGSAIAEAVNGVRLDNNTPDLDEKKALNIVEEMAIASGIPVPPVYIIEEMGINAFAAGYSSKDAVIVVTRGSVRLLNRDELQGVIAHEFSHIFNGDMRLNIRMICVLHGILVLKMIGSSMMQLSGRSGMRHSGNLSYSSRRSGSSAQGALFIFILGIGLYLIGYLGNIFGSLIKAAVSREREFLADASAVQFTRNPDGISNALKKIGGYAQGSYIEAPAAMELSHLFFNQALTTPVSSWMATHPPLKERIKRIEPFWRGDFIKTTLPYTNPFAAKAVKKYTGLDTALAAIIPAATLAERLSAPQAITQSQAAPATILKSIGQPTSAHIAEARNFLDSLPPSLTEAAHDAYSARALVYCLLLDNRRAHILEQQLLLLKQGANPQTWKEVMALKETLATLPLRHRLPLIDMCIPTLKQLRPLQYQDFKKHMLSLIHADNKIDLFEWALYRIVVQHLENTTQATSNKTHTLQDLHSDCQRLISAVALKNTKSISDAKQFFARGWQEMSLPESALIEDALEDINALNSALKKAATLHPLKKPQLIKACCAALKDINQPECFELLRAIADGLDVPIPPFVLESAAYEK